MKTRLVWLLVAALGAFLCLSAQPAMAQESSSGTDQGQQGEFTGENVDTGAAALDSGPGTVEAGEANEAGEKAEANESASVAQAMSSTVNTTVQGGSSSQVEADFDLQEIAGTDVAEPN